MDKKIIAISVLSLTAVALFVANLLMPSRATANFVVKDRDYQAVTATLTANDEGLYVLDNRSGLMALFSYDPNRKSLVIRDMKPIMNAFAGMNPGRAK
jgi:hypothetical protein